MKAMIKDEAQQLASLALVLRSLSSWPLRSHSSPLRFFQRPRFFLIHVLRAISPLSISLPRHQALLVELREGLLNCHLPFLPPRMLLERRS